MHAIDGMACATRGCDNRGKLGLNIVGHGSFPTKWGRRWRYRCTVYGVGARKQVFVAALAIVTAEGA